MNDSNSTSEADGVPFNWKWIFSITLIKSELPAKKTIDRFFNEGENISGVIKRRTRFIILASLARERWLGALFTSIKNRGYSRLNCRRLLLVSSNVFLPSNKKVGALGELNKCSCRRSINIFSLSDNTLISSSGN